MYALLEPLQHLQLLPNVKLMVIQMLGKTLHFDVQFRDLIHSFSILLLNGFIETLFVIFSFAFKLVDFLSVALLKLFPSVYFIEQSFYISLQLLGSTLGVSLLVLNVKVLYLNSFFYFCHDLVLEISFASSAQCFIHFFFIFSYFAVH